MGGAPIANTDSGPRRGADRWDARKVELQRACDVRRDARAVVPGVELTRLEEASPLSRSWGFSPRRWVNTASGERPHPVGWPYFCARETESAALELSGDAALPSPESGAERTICPSSREANARSPASSRRPDCARYFRVMLDTFVGVFVHAAGPGDLVHGNRSYAQSCDGPPASPPTRPWRTAVIASARCNGRRRERAVSDLIDQLNAALTGRYLVERELGRGGM